MIRVALIGRHANRTPFAYRPYQALIRASRAFSLVKDPADADLLVVGFERDLAESLEQIRPAVAGNPDLRIAVISEEPLWDSLWSPKYREPSGTFVVDGTAVPVLRINHVTSDLYHFAAIPYFLTTSDDYFVRYQVAFAQRRRDTPAQIVDRWRRAGHHVAFCAEKRLGEKYRVEHPDVDISGLCDFRALVAMATPDADTVRMGKGWNGDTPRQSLPDWHLDKLASLAGQFRVVSALENTHCPDYITEKPFDAFAAGAVPVYSASPAHGLLRLVAPESFINVRGASAEQAAAAIMAFEPDLEAAGHHRAAIDRLATLFTDPATMVAERMRVYDVLRERLTGYLAGGTPVPVRELA